MRRQGPQSSQQPVYAPWSPPTDDRGAPEHLDPTPPHEHAWSQPGPAESLGHTNNADLWPEGDWDPGDLSLLPQRAVTVWPNNIPPSGSSGPWPTGWQLVTADGRLWICTAGGVPGTWQPAAGNATLTAPLQLPALPGAPLTTQGGNTLDNGSGVATLLSAWFAGTPFLDIRTLGAVGDGVHVDTIAIQAALNAGVPFVYVPYTANGFLCGAVTVPSGVQLIFSPGAKWTAPGTLAAPWVSAANTVHIRTAVRGGTFDATAVTSALCTAVLNFAATSFDSIELVDNYIIQAPAHGIFITEATHNGNRKTVARNTVNGHGIVATGYGIYADYVGGIDIDGNWVYSPNGADCIELGHSGVSYLGVYANMKARGNTCIGGQLQFPFSDGALIEGNTVVNATIQNDANTANDVVIAGNVVLNASPGGSFGGIAWTGDRVSVVGNQVTMQSGNGNIGIGSTGATVLDALVEGNVVYSLSPSGTPAGSGISVGNNNVAGHVRIANNVIGGAFSHGITFATNNIVVSGNTLDGATYAFYFYGSAVLGFVPNHWLIEGNDVSGCSNVLKVDDAVVGADVIMRNNPGYNPVGAVTVTPSVHAWNNDTYADVDAYCTATGSFTGIMTLTLPGSAAITVPNPVVGMPVRVPPGSTLTWGVGGAVTSDPSFDGVGY